MDSSAGILTQSFLDFLEQSEGDPPHCCTVPVRCAGEDSAYKFEQVAKTTT